MRLPQATIKPFEPLIACLLAIIGLSDFTAASLADVVALEYWLTILPIRLTFLFALTGYIYIFKSDDMLQSATTGPQSLCNNLTFTWAFFELTMWFWIYTNMRQQRVELAKKILQKE